MPGQPPGHGGDPAGKIGENGLGAGPPAPDASIEHGKEHHPDEKEKRDEEKEVGLADPDHGAEEIQFERRDIEPEGALAVYSHKRQPENNNRLDPCREPALCAEG